MVRQGTLDAQHEIVCANISPPALSSPPASIDEGHKLHPSNGGGQRHHDNNEQSKVFRLGLRVKMGRFS
jgi:hypothetical protein